MAKGILYVMSTCVEGLVKIGMTGENNFEQRMYNLEKNGYNHISVLTREFAILVNDYERKEKLLHEIFSKSRVGQSELFSVDLSLVKELMSSFDGKVIFPPNEEKDDIFEQSAEITETKSGIIPDGIYTMKTKTKGFIATGTMKMENGVLTVKAGSVLAPIGNISVKGWIQKRNSLLMDGNVCKEDFVCDSPSMAAAIICGHNQNGWNIWKNSDGVSIDCYRNHSLND